MNIAKPVVVTLKETKDLAFINLSLLRGVLSDKMVEAVHGLLTQGDPTLPWHTWAMNDQSSYDGKGAILFVDKNTPPDEIDFTKTVGRALGHSTVRILYQHCLDNALERNPTEGPCHIRVIEPWNKKGLPYYSMTYFDGTSSLSLPLADTALPKGVSKPQLVKASFGPNKQGDVVLQMMAIRFSTLGGDNYMPAARFVRAGKVSWQRDWQNDPLDQYDTSVPLEELKARRIARHKLFKQLQPMFDAAAPIVDIERRHLPATMDESFPVTWKI